MVMTTSREPVILDTLQSRLLCLLTAFSVGIGQSIQELIHMGRDIFHYKLPQTMQHASTRLPTDKFS